MDNRDPLHRWHHSGHLPNGQGIVVRVDNGGHQEVEEMDEGLVTRWSSRLTNNEGDRLPLWTGSIAHHLEERHPGTATDDAALRLEETEGRIK
eukprot:5888295-Amphidinium_carterae.1